MREKNSLKDILEEDAEGIIWTRERERQKASKRVVE
jgi:hypothetical protein